MTWKSNTSKVVNQILRRFDIQCIRGSDIWRPLARLGRQPIPVGLTEPFSPPLVKSFQGRKLRSLQASADFAVIMPTVLRPTIADAIRSIFDQRYDGSVQTLIGIDTATSDLSLVEEVCRRVPDWHSVLLFYPGYSTSRRHGGVHATWDGGAMRDRQVARNA